MPVFLIAASLFFTNPSPLDMPRADAYLVKDEGRYRLEDRFSSLDLWQDVEVLGRWEDDEGRVFTMSCLDVKVPEGLVEDRLQTRSDFFSSREALGRKADIRPSIDLLAPGALAEEPRKPHQLPRGFKAVQYYQHPTNLTTIVCAFLTEKGSHWHLVSWELAPGDDYVAQMTAFEEKFLDPFRRHENLPPPIAAHFAADESDHRPRRGRHEPIPGERELLRADAHHNVTNYVNWHWVDAPEFTVLSDMPRDRDFLIALTNDLHVMRRRYSEVLPTHIDGTNVLCVARLFANRDEYLDAAGDDMTWTAAFWSPMRRELVAYLPENGEKELLKTIRHEAFHQYLSYATATMTVSPWLNEGYAQYFEDEKSLDWGRDFDLSDEGVDTLAQSLSAVLGMDYEQFYAGSDRSRRVKYRLAWSIACFLEKGASKVRFQPFKNLKATYFKALFETQDSAKATSAAFRNEDNLKLFVAEWKKFWKGN